MALREISYINNNFSINYEILNPKMSKTIIILHGWGSNKEIMSGVFKKVLGEFKHIYIDMPEFGKSSDDMILTTKDYADILDLLLLDLKIEKEIIFGHSFGGKVATLLNPKTLVLLSTSGILVPKSFKVRSKIALFKLLKPFGFLNIRRFFASSDVLGMSQVMYETFKNVVDEDFEDSFKNFKNQALIFWGKDDTATPLYTGEKISQIINNSKFFPLDGDHYFFTKHSSFIEKELNANI